MTSHPIVAPDTVAEAKQLIPSLGDMEDEQVERLTDEQLQELLDILKKLRKY